MLRNIVGGGGSGPLLVLLAAVLWGTTGTAQHFAPAGASPLTVGALRLVIGGAVLWAVVQGRTWAGRGRNGRLKEAGFRRHPALLGAAVGVAGYQVAFFAGVARTGVAVGTLVAIGSAPVWAGLMEMMFWQVRPSARWVAATAVAVVGAGLLVGGGRPDGFFDAGGVLLTLAAGGCFALYTVSHKAVLRRHPGEGDRIAAAALFGGGGLLLPALLAGDVGWLREPAGMAVALHLGLVATALAYTLFGRGLLRTSAAAATTLTLAEPLIAAALGVALLGERPGPGAAVGGLLVLLGLLLLAGDGTEVRDGASAAGSPSPSAATGTEGER